MRYRFSDRIRTELHNAALLPPQSLTGEIDFRRDCILSIVHAAQDFDLKANNLHRIQFLPVCVAAAALFARCGLEYRYSSHYKRASQPTSQPTSVVVQISSAAANIRENINALGVAAHWVRWFCIQANLWKRKFQWKGTKRPKEIIIKCEIISRLTSEPIISNKRSFICHEHTRFSLFFLAFLLFFAVLFVLVYPVHCTTRGTQQQLQPKWSAH